MIPLLRESCLYKHSPLRQFASHASLVKLVAVNYWKPDSTGCVEDKRDTESVRVETKIERVSAIGFKRQASLLEHPTFYQHVLREFLFGKFPACLAVYLVCKRSNFSLHMMDQLRYIAL